jgi:hypothetical protein
MDITLRPTFFTEYAEQDDNEEVEVEETELVIPENFDDVSDEDLANLHSGAIDAFNALYGSDGSGLDDDALDALSVLTKGIERVQTELDTRKNKQSERQEKAAELAAKAGITLSNEGGDGEEEEGGEETPAEETPQPSEDPGPETPTETPAEQTLASQEIRINLSGLRSRQSAPAPAAASAPEGGVQTMRDIVKAAPDLSTSGYSAGTGLDWDDLGKGLDRRLASFNRAQWEAAHAAKRHLRTQLSLAVIQKPFEDGLTITSDDPRHIDKVLSRATDEKRLEGNSLVAAGGWCAPSETIYDLMEMESRDGIYSLPTIGITRGGLSHTPGPDFSAIFALATGFHYTEEQDIAGNYGTDANGVGNDTAGNKPCFRVPCPDFTDDRLAYDGLCVTAGLLQQRGYPEVIARTVRGALVAHDHRIAGRVLGDVITGSTAVAMPASQVGATAPILTAIELQVEHYRTVHRLSRATSLEAVFPYWVHGAIRSDLSRRLGVDLLDVSDARIAQWFRDRGVAPQFVYNFDDLSGAAGAVTAWPTTLRFVLYAAGTWVQGSSDIITLDTVYDSVLLGQNDFTALFTEEGYLVAKRGHDSRVVSVPISTDGATHSGVSIDHNGAQSAVAQV